MEQVMEHKDTDVAWCAGFFDGEGHVSYTRSIPSKSTGHVSAGLRCSVPQHQDNLEVLEFFRNTVRMGKILGPQDGGPQFRLIFATDDVQKLLIILKPYLKTKKTEDFQRALTQYWMHDSTATPEDIARMVKRAKKKGCPQCGCEWNGIVCPECGTS